MPTTPEMMKRIATSAWSQTVTTRQAAAMTHCSQSSIPTGETVAGMKDQGDDGRAHAVEDRGHPGQPTEMDVKRAKPRDDQEIRQDKGPAAGPRTPEPAPQIGDEDADLDREGTGQRLADGHGIAHLLPGQPLAFTYELPFHQADKRHRPAEPQSAETEEINDDFAERTAVRQCGGESVWTRRFGSGHFSSLGPRRDRRRVPIMPLLAAVAAPGVEGVIDGHPVLQHPMIVGVDRRKAQGHGQ